MIQNNTYVCFEGEKVETCDKKKLGPIFCPWDQNMVRIFVGNNSANSKALNLKF